MEKCYSTEILAYTLTTQKLNYKSVPEVHLKIPQIFGIKQHRLLRDGTKFML
jgi:hypothetical protein